MLDLALVDEEGVLTLPSLIVKPSGTDMLLESNRKISRFKAK